MNAFKSLITTLIILLCGTVALQAQAPTGTLRGKVTSGTTGEPLLGATVRVLANGKILGGAFTDLEGAYSTKVPVGEYDLIFSMASYSSDTIRSVSLTEGQVVVKDVLLTDKFAATVVIEAKANQASKAAFMVNKMKANFAMDGITADLAQRAGDVNVGQSVTRVVGVTVTNGRNIVVRGMGDRYNKTLLNSAEIPGLDPDRNGVQLDIFPSNLIDNVQVIKNFTPDLPGDFSGGLVNIVTKDFPNAFTVGGSFSASYNDQASLRNDFLTSDMGSAVWRAGNDGTFDEPSFLQDLRANGERIPFRPFFTNGEDAAVVDRASNSFTTPITPSVGNSGLNTSLQFSIGNQMQLGKDGKGGTLGYIAGLSYRSSFGNRVDWVENRFSLPDQGASGLAFNRLLDTNGSRGVRNVLWGLVGKLSYKYKSHKVSFNYMRNQSFQSTTTYLEGLNSDVPTQIPSDRSENVEELEFYQTSGIYTSLRAVDIFQLSGSSAFGADPENGKSGIKLDWIASFAPSELDEPDFRFFTNGYAFPTGSTADTAFFIAPSTHQLPGRFFRNMKQDLYNVKADLTIPYKFSGRKAEVKLGGNLAYKDRTYQEVRYQFALGGTPFDGNVASLFAPENLGIVDTVGSRFDTGIGVIDRSLGQNSYSGEQTVIGSYLMTVLPISDKLRAIGGVRYERTDATIISEDTVNFPEARLDLNDVLPSLSLVYSPADRMNIRLAAYRTLARPTFREFSPLITFDFNGDLEERGNVNLRRTLIDNLDLRWEWFFGLEELVSVSVFYKDFIDPIQKTFLPGLNALQYQNVPNATNLGLEVEFRKKLGFIGEGWDRFELGGNAALIRSRIDIQADELEAILAVDPSRDDTRPLQGQSPYAVNGSLNYDGENGMILSLNYNVFGPRLFLVGASGTPDVYEQPRHSLNFSASKTFADKITIRFRANNILNPQYLFTQSYGGQVENADGSFTPLPVKDFVFRSYRQGRSFSLSVGFKLNNE
ncbi:MAG: TonB-dependent receptor [Bacteroidota bacterium]